MEKDGVFYSSNNVGHPRLIVFEGTDGSGKTTQAKWLVSKLQSCGIPAVYTCEPTDGCIGQHIRSILRKEVPAPDPRTMAMLFTTDRYMHCQDIRQWISQGVTVVADRYLWSTLAYNCRTPDEMYSAIEMHKGFYILPDMTVLLSMAPSDALARKGINAAELFETEEYLSSVVSRYEQLFSGFFSFVPLTKDRCVIESFRPIEKVQQEIWDAIQPLFV